MGFTRIPLIDQLPRSTLWEKMELGTAQVQGLAGAKRLGKIIHTRRHISSHITMISMMTMQPLIHCEKGVLSCQSWLGHSCCHEITIYSSMGVHPIHPRNHSSSGTIQIVDSSNIYATEMDIERTKAEKTLSIPSGNFTQLWKIAQWSLTYPWEMLIFLLCYFTRG